VLPLRERDVARKEEHAVVLVHGNRPGVMGLLVNLLTLTAMEWLIILPRAHYPSILSFVGPASRLILCQGFWLFLQN
jgi:hypothetical protein